VEKSAFLAKQHQDHDTDKYAAAVASVFLNATTRTTSISHDTHCNSVTTSATDVVTEDCGASCSNFHESVSTAALDDLNAATSSILSSVENATCALSSQNDSDSQLAQPKHTCLHPVPSATEDSEEIKLTDCIASELGSAACDELSDYWDPIELLLRDKSGTLNDVCNSSLFGDLSFSSECLVEDGGSAQLLACPDVASEVLNNIQKAGMADDSQCTSEFIGNLDVTSCVLAAVVRSADVVPVASIAAATDDDYDHSVGCFQQSEPSYSQTCVENNSVIVSVDGENASKSASIAVHSTSASASCNIGNSESGDQLTLAVQQAANDSCHFSILNSNDEHKSLCVNLDINDSELVKPVGTDSVDSDELIVPSSDMKVVCEDVRESCDALAMENAKNLSTATRKRLLPEENFVCKRFRAEGDCPSAGWLAAFDSSMHERVSDNVNTSMDSTDSHSLSDTSVANNTDELRNVCCHSCNLPCVASSLSYCTDGHACCLTCLQHQVKRLLSSPSKVRVCSLLCFSSAACAVQQDYQTHRLEKCTS